MVGGSAHALRMDGVIAQNRGDQVLGLFTLIMMEVYTYCDRLGHSIHE